VHDEVSPDAMMNRYSWLLSRFAVPLDVTETFRKGRLVRVEGLAQSALIVFLPAPLFEVRCTRELKADTLKKAALGSDVNSFTFPVVSENRSAIAFSL